MKCVSALLAASLFGVVFGVEPSVSDLSNLATVGRVDSEAGGELVGGFVVEGGEGEVYLITARGPDLASDHAKEPIYSVEEVLADPRLTVVRHLENGESEVVGSNDDWVFDDEPRLGHYLLPDLNLGSKDSVLVIDLEPGIYTAIVDGKGASGMASIEVEGAVWMIW